MKLTRAQLSKIVKEEIQKLTPRKKIVEAPEEGDISPEKFKAEIETSLNNYDIVLGGAVAVRYIDNVFKTVATVAKNNNVLYVNGAVPATVEDVKQYYEYMTEGDAMTLDELEYEISQGILGVLMDASEKIAETMSNYYSISQDM